MYRHRSSLSEPCLCKKFKFVSFCLFFISFWIYFIPMCVCIYTYTHIHTYTYTYTDYLAKCVIGRVNEYKYAWHVGGSGYKYVERMCVCVCKLGGLFLIDPVTPLNTFLPSGLWDSSYIPFFFTVATTPSIFLLTKLSEKLPLQLSLTMLNDLRK